LPGARLGPYAIVSLLGRGGMGEVYRAVDTRIDRSVAIKILPADAAANVERRQRFEREARAIARLNHPHICVLYDVGHQDDVEFLVMEYLEGETLVARLSRGALPLDEALRHAAALADALARAHHLGVIHRDIKPANIFLTPTGAKLLDFGLAKRREVDAVHALGHLGELSTAEGLSRDGALIGTYVYMAPEQLEGHPADVRTDIFALGLVIYEMITGRKAFEKPSQAGIIAAILTEEPRPVTALQPGVPKEVERVVRTCLAKNPNERWQDAGDLGREFAWLAAASDSGTRRQPVRLRRPRLLWLLTGIALAVAATFGLSTLWHRRGVTQPRRSLVVLPCRAIGDDAMTQAYCDGLADTLSAKLMPVTGPNGLQMTSTLEAREQRITDAAAARRQFGATLVLEGSVLRSGGELRVNYAIVDTNTSTQLDAFSMTGASNDPFALQDRVTDWAVRALVLKVNQPEQRALASHGTQNAAAYELYLQGRGFLLDPQKPENVDSAIRFFERAVAMDSRFALAHAGVGRAYLLKYITTKDPAWVVRGEGACDQATSLDESLPEAHICLGTLKNGVGSYKIAIREFQKALEQDPTSDEAYIGLAQAQEQLGDLPAAEQTYRHAVALRPQYWAAHTWLANFYRSRARYSEAADEYRQAVRLTPNNPKAYSDLAVAYGSLGNYTEAIRALNKSVELQPTFAGYTNLGATYFRMRQFDDAIRAFERARTFRPKEGTVIGSLARACYWKGDKDRAKALYAEALAQAQTDLAVNPRVADLHILLAEYHSKLGNRAEAFEEVARAGDITSNPHLLLFEAFVYNQFGDRGGALNALELAKKGGLPIAELRAWPELDTLRSEPRFQALLTSP
jgi:serine/threonine-protein kinase